MRRRWVHLSFGVAALAFASLAAIEGARMREAERVNDAIAGRSNRAAESQLPEARFFQAMAQAKRGDYEAALKTYKELGLNAHAELAIAALYNAGNLQLREASKGVGLNAHAELAIAALYNAGNLQLREASKGGPDAAVRALPLVELAKQSYRAALRRDPQSWDARYNLERALWLAPELEEQPVDRIRRDVEERVMSTLQNTRAELP
jgi:mxaK protein